MRLFILLIFLTGCGDRTIRLHRAAKLLGDTHKVCYTITDPEDIRGYYCLEYEGRSENK